MGARSRCAQWARVYGTPKPLQILDDRIIIGFGIEPSRESLKPPLPYCDPWQAPELQPKLGQYGLNVIAKIGRRMRKQQPGTQPQDGFSPIRRGTSTRIA